MDASLAHRFSRLVGLAIALALVCVAVPSRAEDGLRLTVDWAKLVEKGSLLVRDRSESPDSKEARHSTHSPELGTAWFGVAPRVSLVARDWGGARRLAGGQLSITDAIRLSRSSQMLISRIRLGEQGIRFARVTPFAQVGLGQWRVDTEIMPLMKRDTELAAQFGGGLEIRVTKGWQLATEVDLTVLYREQREPQHVATPRLWGAFLASRLEF